MILYFMRNIFLIFIFVFTINCDLSESNAINAIEIKPAKILLGTLNNSDSYLTEISQLLKKTLEKTGQFEIVLQNFELPKTKKEIKDFFDQGFGLIIFLNQADENKSFEWRLYDATEAQMIVGKKMQKRGSGKNEIRSNAYNLADEIWSQLTNQPVFFSSKIAYIKIVKGLSKKHDSIISYCDFDGSNIQELKKMPGNYVGLYWNKNINKPGLICSELTKYNARFINVSLKGKKRPIFNFKGTCVGVSISPDSTQAIYCRSGNIWSYKYDKINHKGLHKKIISNGGKNIYPILLNNGDIIFCSDAKCILKKAGLTTPQICYYNFNDQSINLITQDGYCLAPAYCHVNNKLAYSKKVKGIMQLFIYDFNTKKHEQITFDEYNKIDSSWSPCGNFLVFCSQNNKRSRIAILYLPTNKKYYITDVGSYCISPVWSSNYSDYSVFDAK